MVALANRYQFSSRYTNNRKTKYRIFLLPRFYIRICMVKVYLDLKLSNRNNDHTEEAERNIRRYRQKAKKLMLNVASGQFPGKY